MSGSKKILHVVSNVDKYQNHPDHPTGLWLSELTHAFEVFEAKGYQQTIVSPKGGKVPIEPKSVEGMMADKGAKEWLDGSQEHQKLLQNTLKPSDVNPADFDAIYFTGGHSTMFDFENDAGLQKLTTAIWEKGGVVSSVCHGYCGLLNTKLSDGKLLVDGKKLTGFSWIEEKMAGVGDIVPYNAQEEMTKRGAKYEKALTPFVSNVVVDGRLVTGQNPGSAENTAKAVVEVLGAA